MSHPFGNLLSQHLHRRYGLSQARLAAGILQDPSIIGKMCKGERLTGQKARERVVAIIGWLHAQGVLETEAEASALLAAAGMPVLCDDDSEEFLLLQALRSEKSVRTPGVSTSVRRANLPAPMTSFVGRTQELAKIEQMLADHRLVTITGVGGIGKTRTAIEVASRFVSQDGSPCAEFSDGVWFVPLEAVDVPERMASAIADAIQCPPPGASEVGDHLLAYLHPRQMLLVLDNLEHLRDGSDFLTAIMLAAPQVTLLVTSREALNLEQEWRVLLHGLSLAAGSDTAPIQSSAARLFGERARRVSPAFDYVAEGDVVEHICRLVEGSPLAIELAATWTRALSCEAIAEQIVGDLAFLTSNMRNMPMRHRSMRAVFDHSWMLLSDEERRVFARLSVFQGGFTRAAAEEVTDASLSLLSTLIDKSLVRVDHAGRYSVHVLLRQYAQEWLKRDGQTVTAVYEAHSVYYNRFLAQREATITRSGQRHVLQEVADDLENIRAAWTWAAERLRGDLMIQSASTLIQFCDCRCRYREGVELCEQAIEKLLRADRGIDHEMALAALFSGVGWLCIHLGRYDYARDAFTRSHIIFSETESSPLPGYVGEPVLGMALLADVLGNYADALTLAHQALEVAIAHGDTYNQVVAHYILASTAYTQGRYGDARQQAERAYTLAASIDTLWMMAYTSIILGNVARACHDYREAHKCYTTCYTIQSELGNPEGMAAAQLSLAGLAASEHDFPEAERQYRDSYVLYRDINDPGGQMRALTGLGNVAHAQGNSVQACHHFCASLEIAVAIRSAPLLLAQLTPIGELLAALGEPSLAATAWTLVTRDAASERATIQRAQENLRRAQGAYGQIGGTASGDLFALAVLLRDTLAQKARDPNNPIDVSRHPPAPIGAVLIEPLSERELEILRLISAGMTNQQIADRLTVVVGTVKAHNHHIFGKLGVSNRVQALARAKSLSLL